MRFSLEMRRLSHITALLSYLHTNACMNLIKIIVGISNVGLGAPSMRQGFLFCITNYLLIEEIAHKTLRGF